MNDANAQAPDLTNGEARLDDLYWNLGPTGMSGWFYRPNWTAKYDGWNTEFARQIEVITVDAGSPADGILQVGDVILGADGTGATPANFTSDARKAFADAIGDAEASSPATLNLLVWRAGTTSTMSLTLETLGAYSATAPYNCPKSAAILEKGLDAIMAQGGTDEWKFSLITLLAGNDPSNPDNAARMARAQQEAYALILTPEQIAEYTAPEPLTFSKVAWAIGFKLTAMAEYYLHTGDPAVYDSLRAYAIAAANGQTMFGTSGHQFAKKNADGSLNGPYGIGYGVVSSANMQCFLGLTLAKKAGVTDQAVVDAVERAANFYSAYVDRGTIPYGEHEPGTNYGDNGKSGVAALCFKAEGTRNYEANYYATLAASAAVNLDAGHQGPWLNYLWSPLGANAAGEAAMAAFFAEQKWRYELARNWDGTFTYNSYQNGGQYGYGGKTWTAKNFQMYQAMLLPYAAPLRETYLTGKNTADPAKWLGATELSDIQTSSGYDATTRSTNELLADLGIWSPVTRIAVAAEIGQRTAEHATLLPTLHTMATDTNASLQSRMGACRALGQIKNNSSVSLLVGMLTDPDTHLRWAAASALSQFTESVLIPEADAIMAACIAEAKPVLPIDTEDPVHLTHKEIIRLLFSKTIRNHDLVGIDRDLLIPAIRAGAAHPMGGVRGDVGSIYSKLSRDEIESLADVLVDGTLYEAPADRMFSVSVRMAGLNTMQAHNFAEGVRLAMILTEELNSKDALNTLIAYAGDSLLVEPDHEVLEWLDVLEASDSDLSFINASNWPDPGTHNHIQWVRDAINGDPGPYEKPEAFKRIYTVYADDAILTLPDYWTGLHVGAHDFAQGESVYTWRKVHGLGEVSFYPNGTAAAKDTAVIFDGVPGEYLFEVKMSDSLGFSEVTQTVAVTLEKVGGGLDPNLAPTADNQSVTVSDGTPTSIMLTGSDPEGFSLSYSVTSGPTNGTLSGTAPSLVYTPTAGYTGSDSISFEVMDSEGQVASGTVSITVGAGAPVGLAIYEPFDYAAAAMLNGLSGSTEIGFADASTWTAGPDIYVDATATTGGTSPSNAFDAASANTAAGGYAYGPLPTTGSKLWNRAMNSIGQSRPIHPNALTNSGLLADGATLWFSVLIGADDTWLRDVQIALGNASFGSTKNFIQDDGADPGTGLGFEFNADKQFYAVQFFDATQSTPLRGDFNLSAAGQFARYGDLRLVVGKITWGASSDTVEMYLPHLPEAGASIILPDQPSSTLVANVDQSKFDVLTVSRGSNVWVDEIRFGSTLQSVLMGTVDAGGVADDGVAPTPNPMTFAVAPSMMSQDSITMTATPAYDPLGVEYYFTCTAGAGGSDSGWQDSNVYTDTGLTPGVAYSYTVKARDKTPGLNETAASAAASATIPSLGTVPDLVGLEQSIAETLLADAGMALGTVTDAVAYSLTVPAGHVLTQSPVGPASSAYGTAVNLEISIGQDPALPTLAQVDILDDKGGVTVTLPATINYTLTFSQDMDAATIDAGDFLNMGELPILIGSIIEIAPGVVTVEVIPNSIDGGILRFAIAQGAVIQDALGNALNTSSPIVDEETISIVRPANYAPTVDAGPDQTVSMDSPQPWSPYLMTAAAWYDAADAATITQSAGKVSKWDDKSGNGNHASQSNSATQPSYNSSDVNLNNLPSIGYDQAFKTLVTGNSFTAQRAYVVTYYNQTTFGSWHNAVTDKGNTIRFVGGNAGQNYLTSGPAKTGTAYQNGDRAANLVDGSNPAVLPMSASVWTVTANATTLDQWVLLGGTVNYSGWENGALAEVILTDGSESLETQQMVEGYLAHKWGLEASLAANHPYKLEAPTSPAALAVLDATVNDNDNDPLTTFWTMISGPQGVTFGNASSVDTTATLVEAGTYVLQLSANDSKVVVSDQITITVNAGSDTTPPSIVGSDIVDDRGGLDVSENELVTYTVTFSEDMNAATVNASDFSNAGSSSISIGAITETSPGVFTIEVTPTGVGSLQLQVSAGAVLSDLSSNALDTSSAIVDDTIINVVAASSNTPPVFVADPFSAGDATVGLAYTATISGSANDVNVGDTLSYTKSGGPAWLSVAANGGLSGTPSSGDLGLNSFTVSVSDGNGGSDVATLNITVNTAAPNNPPVVDAGADQTVSISAGGAPWTPAGLSTAAWYDAADAATITESGGAVSNWLDKSGNGKHASQSNSSLRPVSGTKNIGGKNVIDFEVTSSQSLNMPTIDVIGKEVWAVFVFDSYATTNSQLLLGGGGNIQIGVNSSSQNLRLWKSSNPYSADSKSTATVPVLTPALAGWLAHTDTKKFAVNGVFENTSNSYNSGDLSPNQIGRGQYTAMDGAIGEIVITSGALSTEDREKMEGYLAHKWSLQANLPAGHPYKSAAPTGGSAAVANLDGTVSDPDSDPFSSTWSFVSGPAAVDFGDASAEDTTATFTALGTYVLELTANDGADITSDQVTITVDDGNDITAPTLAATDIVDDQAGANVTENDLVTYTVTFSEDIDAATVGATDFSNAGTSSVTIGAITETTPGVFTVEVTPTTAGSLQLQVSAAAVLTDVAGNALDTTTAIADDTVITVDAANVAPVWTSDPVNEIAAAEDAAYSSTLADDASDANVGDSLTFSKVSGPAWLSVAANGALSGTPTNADVGANAFTVSVSDSIATAVNATLHITVSNTNDVPVFTADPIAGNAAVEDLAYSGSIAGSATDDDAGASLSYAKVSGPAWLSVATNGALSGTPTNADVGANAFTVSVTDGIIVTPVEATLNITVTNTNDAPVFIADPIAGADATEDALYSGTIVGSAVDNDGNALSYAKVSGPAWLSVATDGALSGTPTNADVGVNAFTVSVTDGIIVTPVEATLNITVTNTNDAPVFAANPISGSNATEDAAYVSTIAGSASDVDSGDTLSYAKVSGPAWLSVAVNGDLSGTPTNSDVGANAFTVSVSDGTALPVEATLNITVTNTNDAPVFAANPISGSDATEDAAYVGTIAGSATDEDAGDTLTYAKVSGPTWLSVAANGDLSGTPTNGDIGANNFIVQADDGSGGTATATLTVNVVAAPAQGFVDGSTPGGVMPLSGGTAWELSFSDEFNGASLNTSKWNVDVSTTSRAARPTQGIDQWYWKSENVSLDGTGNLQLDVTKQNSNTMYCGSVSSDGLYEPTYGYLEARIQIADTTKSTHTAFWLQGPNMLNSDPADGTGNDGAEIDIFESAWFGDYTKSVVHIDGYDQDHQANTKQYSTPGLHSGYHVFGMEWTDTSLKIYYDGVLKVTYTGIWVPQVAEWLWLSCGASFGDVGTFASEPIGLLTSAKVDYVRVWQALPNVAPVFTVDPIAGSDATEDASYGGSIAGSATDSDGDGLTYAKVSGPAWLSVAANGALSGTPSNSDVGANAFTVSVSDGNAPAVNATLNITVINTNDAPVFAADPIAGSDATEDVAYAGTIAGSATDEDVGDTLIYTKVSGPAWLSVGIDGALSGTPTNADVGANAFTISVSDGNGPVVTATLNIAVLNTNYAPVFAADPINGSDATEDAAYSATIAGSATDADVGDTLSYAKVSGPVWLTVAANGDLSGTPTNADVGTNAFTVSVTDGIIATPVEATLNITVINTNDAPVFTVDPIAGSNATEDAVYVGTIAGSASDVDAGATLTYSKVSGAAWLSVAIDGTLSGTPTNADVGANAFTVSVTDGIIATPVQATLNITVNVAGQGGTVVSAGFNNVSTTAVDTTGLLDWGYVSQKADNSKTGGFGSISEVNATGQDFGTLTLGAYGNLTTVSGSSLIGAVNFTEGAPSDVLSAAFTSAAGGWYTFDGNDAHGDMRGMDGNEQDVWTLKFNDLGIGQFAITVYLGVSQAQNNKVFDMDYSLIDSSTVSGTSTSAAGSTYSLVTSPESFNLFTYNIVVTTVTAGADLSLTFGGVSGANGGEVLLSGYTIAALTPPVGDTTPPTLAASDFVDDKAGANVTENDLVTYTVSFSEDMDAATVDATDFSNAGTASVTIGTITETTPGVFTVEVTPTTVGSLQLQVSAAAVLTDVAGNALDTTAAISDDTIITVDSATTTVPNVIGLAQATAEVDIVAANLLVGTVSSQNDAVVPAGDVISQSPVGSTSVAIGSSVDIVVSLGPVMTIVPNVIGLAQATAEANIVAANLVVGAITSQNHATVPAGDVISQSLIAGASVAENTSVDLVVSLGPVMTTVPNVVGLAQATAEADIVTANLVVGTITSQNSATVPTGNVISQSPSGGASVAENTSVNLVISLGPAPSAKLVRTTVTGVSNTTWTTINFGKTYTSPVIVATPIYTNSSLPPVVTRIRNVTPTSFDLKLDRADGSTAAVTMNVSVVAVEEGVYTQANDGVTMEAVKYTSTITSYGPSNWVGEARNFLNSYSAPVVIGQVMSYNDTKWSVFWSMGASRTEPVSATSLNVGKNVGQDPVNTRADETIGYIVIESGSGTIDGVAYEAGLGADIVQCFGDSSTPYSYGLSGGLSSVSTAVVSQSGMDGNDGSWAVLSGSPAVTTTTLKLHLAEDALKDSRRKHTSEQVGYIVFE